MAKIGTAGTSSWLTAVKRAFRSPVKDNEKRSSQNRRQDVINHQNEHHEEQVVKKREKRRWLFRKSNHENVIQQSKPANTSTEEHKHAIAMAVATAAAAEAAVATVHTAMEVADVARPSPINYPKEHYAAITVQTAFRGYLARRALHALKGLVKLQALVRGYNVRKQAKMTLRCMQALLRVQAQMLDQRMRQTNEGSRKSTLSDSNIIRDSLDCFQDISDRRSISKYGSNIDDWDECPHTIEEVKTMQLRQRKEASLKHERKLSQTFSEQMWMTGWTSSLGSDNELGEKHQWRDGWVAEKPWKYRRRASSDQRNNIKTFEINTPSQSYSYLHSNFQTSSQLSHKHQEPGSPLHRSNYQNQQLYFPVTPSPSKIRTLQIRSASPHCAREETSYHNAQTPSMRSNYYYTYTLHPQNKGIANASSSPMPNYMAATESAKARIRSQSAPRQRPLTPEREKIGAKKRLSYPVPDPYNLVNAYHSMKSPSIKSITGAYMGYEQRSNYSSCCTESLGGEVSPSSTSDPVRWLR